MLKLGHIEIGLDGMAYFGIQSPLLRAYNLAHYINKFLDIRLAKTVDFEKYDSKTKQLIAFSCYLYVSETEQCSYHLIENKKGVTRLFSNYPNEDFWFLVKFENGLKDHRLSALKERLYRDIIQVKGVFSVIQVESEKLANFKGFKDDFSEYCTRLMLNC